MCPYEMSFGLLNAVRRLFEDRLVTDVACDVGVDSVDVVHICRVKKASRIL